MADGPQHLSPPSQRRNGLWPAVGATIAGIVLGLIGGFWMGSSGNPEPRPLAPSPAVSRQLAMLPACRDAIDRADQLAARSGRLADAATHHAGLMDALDRFLEGEPGGMDPHAVYEMGKQDVATFRQLGPTMAALASAYEEVKHGCSLPTTTTTRGSP